MKYLWIVATLIAPLASAPGQAGGLPESRQGTYGVLLKGGPSFPLGQFSDLFGVGYAGFLEVPYHLSDDFRVFLGLGGMVWNVDDDKVNRQYAALGGSGTVSLDAPYRMIPLSAGITYGLGGTRLRPYVTLAFSIYFQALETSGTVTVGDVITPIPPSSESWSQGAFSLGLGTEYELDERWSLDLDARFGAVIDYEARVLIGTGGQDVVTRAIRFAAVMGGISYVFR